VPLLVGGAPQRSRELEFGFRSFSFAGSYAELLQTTHRAIVARFAGDARVEGLRFVGSNSLQRPLEETRVVDLDVHLVLARLDAESYAWATQGLAAALASSLPAPGPNLASVGVVRGPYKPPPIESGIRLFAHALVGDRAQYLRSNPLARYSWRKYAPELGSFESLDALAAAPSVADVVHGRAGLRRRAQRIRSGVAELTVLEERASGRLTEIQVACSAPWVLHELYASSVVYSYRHLCRALGVLDESLSNAGLVERDRNGAARDSHGILSEPEAQALATCVESKGRLRQGRLEELQAQNLARLHQAAIGFLESLASRYT
jgi:hypothetical protein